MELQVKQQGNVYIIFIISSLDLSNSFAFKDRIKTLIEKGAKKLIISFEHAKYIDSTGITALINMSTYLKKNLVEYRLTDIKGSAKQIFTVSHLELLLPMSETMEKGIKELNGSK